MEKQRIKIQFKSGRRLLVILLLLLTSNFLYAQKVNYNKIKQLRIVPDEGVPLYTKTDLKFSVTIPDVRPSQVQVLAAKTQQDITFRTIRKSEDYNQNGTRIEIWYNFEKSGSYTLAPLPVMILNRRYSLSFDSVNVTDDPATMNPRIVIVFDDGTKLYSDETNFPLPVLTAKTGKKLFFTVNIQYAMQLVQFSWDIPKDSILTCTEEFEFTEVKHRERNYSHTLIPVASFEWTSLTPGMQRIPKIKLKAAGYNGSRSELIFPPAMIDFTESEPKESEAEKADIFSAAFLQEEEIQNELPAAALSKEDCRRIADYYTREHNEFLLYFKARKNRINFEESCGLVVSPNPILPALFMYLALILIAVSIFFIVVFIRKKYRIRTLLFAALLLTGCALLIFFSVKKNERYGISAGCKIYSIPQERAESVSEIESGIRVRILERTEKWYYIEVGESGGWCNADDIFIIR